MTNHSNIKPEFAALSVHVGAGGGGRHTATTKQHCWHVQGTTDDHNGIYDTFAWKVFENSVPDDSVPRHIRLGMIAFHEYQPFWVDVTIRGSVRGKLSPSKATREKRWFYPPISEEVGEHLLDEKMLENQVSKKNKTITDVALNTEMERPQHDRLRIRKINGISSGGGSGGGNQGTADDASSLAESVGEAPDYETTDATDAIAFG